MLELEKTYLAEKLPYNLKSCKFKEIIDVYFPISSSHPKLRLRKIGDEYEITKKEPVKGGSYQKEQTIVLTKNEFDALNKLNGKKVRKIRHYYDYKGRTAEIDVFQDELKGLVLVDFEFKKINEKDNFQAPDFCGKDVTEADFLAGGMICGKKYKDIGDGLNKFGYKKLFLE